MGRPIQSGTNSTTVAVFVDTNILVYSRDRADPTKQAVASEWLKALWDDQSGRTSFQVLSEYYVTVTRKLRPAMTAEDAWSDVRELMAWRPQQGDALLLRESREIEGRYQLSWWDSMIVAAARLQNCASLLTEDLQHGGVIAGVRVINPFVHTVQQARAEYDVPRSSTIRTGHPPRGRPRKT